MTFGLGHSPSNAAAKDDQFLTEGKTMLILCGLIASGKVSNIVPLPRKVHGSVMLINKLSCLLVDIRRCPSTSFYTLS